MTTPEGRRRVETASKKKRPGICRFFEMCPRLCWRPTCMPFCLLATATSFFSDQRAHAEKGRGVRPTRRRPILQRRPESRFERQERPELKNQTPLEARFTCRALPVKPSCAYRPLACAPRRLRARRAHRPLCRTRCGSRRPGISKGRPGSPSGLRSEPRLANRGRPLLECKVRTPQRTGQRSSFSKPGYFPGCPGFFCVRIAVRRHPFLTSRRPMIPITTRSTLHIALTVSASMGTPPKVGVAQAAKRPHPRLYRIGRS